MPNATRPKMSSTTTCISAHRQRRGDAGGEELAERDRRQLEPAQDATLAPVDQDRGQADHRRDHDGERHDPRQQEVDVAERRRVDRERAGDVTAGALPVAATETPSAAPATIPRMMPAWSADVFDVYSCARRTCRRRPARTRSPRRGRRRAPAWIACAAVGDRLDRDALACARARAPPSRAAARGASGRPRSCPR